MPEDDPAGITIDGEKYTMDDLTFRERREVRKLTRVVAEDPDLDLEDAVLDELLVAFATVVKQRTDPAYTLDDALDLKVADIVQRGEAADPPPAAPARKPRAGAKK
jgi:hypothetical protein